MFGGDKPVKSLQIIVKFQSAGGKVLIKIV